MKKKFIFDTYYFLKIFLFSPSFVGQVKAVFFLLTVKYVLQNLCPNQIIHILFWAQQFV
jgi:hypothetical protein